jgi:hypothetical protein
MAMQNHCHFASLHLTSHVMEKKKNIYVYYNAPWVLWKGALAIEAGTAFTVLAIMSRAYLTDHPNHVCPQ